MGRRRRLRGRFVLLLMAAALVVPPLAASPPSAQAAAFTISPSCTTAGGSISASGSGAPLGIYVTFHMPQAMGWSSLQVPVGSARSDTKGNYKGGFSLPSGLAPGGYTVEARWAQGMGSGLLGVATVTVAAQAASCPQDPSTASYFGPVLGISMLSANDGWAVGDPGASNKKKFWHYDGAAWSVYPQEFDGGPGLYSIDMVSATDGWAGGYSGGNLVFYRYDSQSWSLYQTLPAGTYESQVKAINMTSSSDGWALTSENIYHFDGKEWSLTFGGSGYGLVDISMGSSTEGWAATEGARLYRYKDGQWTAFDFQDAKVIYIQNFTSIYMVSATDGWLAGKANLGSGVGGARVDFLAHWDGTEWKVASWGYWCPEFYKGIQSIFMFSSKAGLAVGTNCMLHYDADNSAVWQVMKTPAAYNQFPQELYNLKLRSVSLTSTTQGWIVGEEEWSGVRQAGGFYRYTGASLTVRACE